MLDNNPTLSIITLNMNGLNKTTERQRLSEWIKKQDPTTCLQETHFKHKDTEGLQVKGWRKMFHVTLIKRKLA